MSQTPQPRPLQAGWPGLLPWQGVFCAWVLGLLTWQWPLPAILALAVFLWTWPGSGLTARGKRGNRRLLFMAVPAFVLGLAVMHLIHPGTGPDPDHVEFLEKEHRREARITGTVDQVLPRPGQRLQILLADVVLTGEGRESLNLEGRLLWNWQDPPVRPRTGQQVHAALRVRPIRGMANPGMSRTEDYWARQRVYYRTFSQGEQANVRLEQGQAKARDLRQTLREKVLENTAPGQGQAMLLALLMGDRFLLQQETMDLIQRASLAHSLALSGLHLGFVVALGWLAAQGIGLLAPGIYLRLPRPKLAVVVSIPLVLAYLWLGQAVPSLQRAALMFASWGLLLLLGRQRVLLDGLFLALAIILALSPLTVFDLRLQLSALAVAGIALAWPLGREALAWIGRPWWQKPVAAGLGILAVSCIATLALLPLQAWVFGRVSPHLYLNVLWLPLLGMVVFPLGLGGLVLLLIPYGQPVAAALLGLACRVLEAMLGGLSLIDHAGLLAVFIPARPLWPQFIGFWMLLMAAAAWWKNPKSLRPGIMAAALALLTAPPLVGLALEQRPGVSLHLLDVSQGQAALVETRAGQRWLLDGGGFWTRDFDIGRIIVGLVLTHGRPPRLSGTLLSHADFDHYRGLLYPLRHFTVDAFLSQGRGPADQDGEELEAILRTRNIPRAVLRKGDVIPLDRDLLLEVLHPDDHWINADKDNDASLVLRLVWRGRPLALLPGDVELPSIAALLQSGQDLAADVLVIPHHGSRTSFSPSLYDRVDPGLALVSTGYLNRFNHPHPEIVWALAERDIPLLNTAEHGAITVRWKSPDAGPKASTERKGAFRLQHIRALMRLSGQI
ncbi:MAG TPA: DNA internalization-related competence protein ComEC/Rec2 [Desulfonatronum sp.]|nr:DNA internalization-related competence protein ComEC/Rec2 [Desulfonatronum sp.]